MKLVDAKGLLEELFPENARPTVRWLRTQQKRRSLPYVRLGRLVFFDVEAVRQAIAERHTIGPKGKSPHERQPNKPPGSNLEKTIGALLA